MRFILLLLPFFVFFTSKVNLQKGDQKVAVSQSMSLSSDSQKPFELFPNPVVNQFTLKSSYFSGSELELLVFNVSGKLVVKIEKVLLDEDNSCLVDISHLSSGLYFIQLRTGNYSATKKIYKS